MGFMDKAKQLAEQAQQKLDETQKNFNKSGTPETAAAGRRREVRRARAPDPGGSARRGHRAAGGRARRAGRGADGGAAGRRRARTAAPGARER